MSESSKVLPDVTDRTPVPWPVLPCPPQLPMCSPHTHTPPTLLESKVGLVSGDCPVLSPPHSALLHLPTPEVGVDWTSGLGSGLPGPE